MHEAYFIQDIINQAKKQGKVREITVEVGTLAPIEPNHLRHHLIEAVDWKINIVEKTHSQSEHRILGFLSLKDESSIAISRLACATAILGLQPS